MKKYIAFIMMFVLLFTETSVFAAKKVYDYTEGPVEYTLTYDMAQWTQNVEKDGDKIIMHAGSKIAFSVFLPFEAQCLEIYYRYNTEESGNYRTDIKGIINGVSYNKSVAAAGSMWHFDADGNMYKGDMDLCIETESDIVINEFVFKKKEVAVTSSMDKADPNDRPLVKLNEYETLIQHSIILNTNSPVIKINGAARYINFNNTREVPLEENGGIYLPIETLARALNMYVESIPEEGYALLRSDNYEFVLKDGVLYKKNIGGKYVPMNNILLIKNNEIYAPVRYFAEILGKTVKYKDGFIVADYRNIVDDALNTAMFDKLKEDFNQYRLEAKVGNTYYVAQTENASDNNSGDAEHPFKTLSKAGEVAKAGDKVIIREGIYRETLAPQNDGTATNPIVFEAAEGENVQISTADRIPNTSTTENGLWVFDTGWYLGEGRGQVFLNGESIREGRHPNADTDKIFTPDDIELSPYWLTKGDMKVDITSESLNLLDSTEAHPGNTVISSTQLNQPAGTWTGATVISLHGSGWNPGNAKVDYSEPGILYLGEKTYRYWFYSNAHKSDYCYITDHINTVDSPGEWYWAADGKLYMYPIEGMSPETIELYGKKRMVTVDVTGKKYIQLKNINTHGGGIKMYHSEMCVVNGGTHKYLSKYSFAAYNVYPYLTGDTADPNGAPTNGEMGILIGGFNNAVVNTHIKYSDAAGLYVTGAYATIENNLIEETGIMGSYAGGIYCAPDSLSQDVYSKRGGHIIVNNTVDKTGRSSFSLNAQLAWTEFDGDLPYLPMNISYNIFKNANLCARDTGIVYMHGSVLGTDRLKSDFHHNIASDPRCYDGMSGGLYFDNYMHGVDCHDNIIYYSQENMNMGMGEIYIQYKSLFPRTYATVDEWENKRLGYVKGGFDALGEGDYPKGQFFRAGYLADDEKYTVNYDKFSAENGGYAAKDAEYTSGVTVQDDMVYMNKAGEMLTFKNVDFSNNCNSFAIFFKGNKANSQDAFEIYVGDTLEDAKLTSVYLDALTPTALMVNTATPAIRGCEGVKNVYIKCTDFKSAGIIGIAPIKLSDEVFSEFVIGKTFAGNYSEILSTAPTPEKLSAPSKIPSENGLKTLFTKTTNYQKLKYANVYFEEPVNTFVIAAGSDATYSGQLFDILVDDPNGKSLSQIQVQKTSFTDYTDVENAMSQEIPAGYHDIYIVVNSPSDATYQLGVNFWWFGFRNRINSEN